MGGGANGPQRGDLHVVGGDGCAHAVQPGGRRHGEGAPRSRDRRARRLDGDARSTPQASSSNCSIAAAVLPSGRLVRRPTSGATASGSTAPSALEPNITWIVGRAGRLLVEGGRIAGLALETGEEYRCRALVVTTGTFLNGLVHIGLDRRPSGRAGEPPSRDLAESIKSIGFTWGRLKTGTPPRLDRRSIDFSRFTPERGDDPPVPFSFMTDGISRAQIDCHLLHTTDRVHELVRQHIGESPLFNGQISGIGPRYCPVARGQGHAVRAPRTAPVVSRARRARRRRDLHQRLLDESAGGGAGGAGARASWPRGGRGDAARLCRRV